MKIKVSGIHTIALLPFVLLYNYSVYAQQGTEIRYKNAFLVKAKINEPIQLKDSLSILITSFSVKRAHANEPTKLTIHAQLSKKNNCAEIDLSLHKTQGKPKKNSAIAFWREYKFEFRDYDYDPSFKIIISKTHE